MYRSCLFIGRFQPFHTGHLMVVQGMRKMCHRLVIGVGSSGATSSSENPFTLQERHEMISAALLEANIDDADILDCPDTEMDEHWVDAVLEVTGMIEKVWTGNDLVAELFEAKGIGVQRIKEVPGISGTEIRKCLLEGGDWEAQVPHAVAGILKRIDAKKRV